MTRTLRLGGTGLALIVTLLGCSESHTVDTIDSGVSRDATALTDSISQPRDTGTLMPPSDSGIVMPPSDSGTVMPPIDSGTVMPPIDSGVVTPVDDAGTVTPDDAGIVVPGDDGGIVMPPIDGGPIGVDCGGTTCVDPQICCVAFGGGMTSMSCTARDACMGVTATCDGPEDCSSGQACCAMGGPGGGGGSTGCVADAMCRFGRLCHADSECTGRDTCCSFMGASICSPFCP